MVDGDAGVRVSVILMLSSCGKLVATHLTFCTLTYNTEFTELTDHLNLWVGDYIITYSVANL